MWPKVIAFLYAFCFSVAILDPTFYETAFSTIGLVLFLGGLIGLFLFGFKKCFLSERFWRFFCVSGLLVALRVGWQMFCEHYFSARTRVLVVEFF